MAFIILVNLSCIEAEEIHSSEQFELEIWYSQILKPNKLETLYLAEQTFIYF